MMVLRGCDGIVVWVVCVNTSSSFPVVGMRKFEELEVLAGTGTCAAS